MITGLSMPTDPLDKILTGRTAKTANIMLIRNLLKAEILPVAAAEAALAETGETGEP